MSSLPYRRRLARQLVLRAKDHSPLVVELFAGCGGLALGFKAAGFKTVGYESNPDACETYRQNLQSECHQVVITPDTDVPRPDVLVAGPPCQPFSVTGSKRAGADSRDGFPSFLAAVARLEPHVAVLENVPALVTEHRAYLDGVVGQLTALGYTVDWAVLNAADFGVPQNRRRLFVVAHAGGFAFPVPGPRRKVYSVRDALGSMVRRLPVAARVVTPKLAVSIAKYEELCRCKYPRDLKPDHPARTLTCRNLSGSTGDSVRLRLPDGVRRRLTLREAARLQSFPDWFRFAGSATSQYYQIGNAVPPLLARAVAAAVRSSL